MRSVIRWVVVAVAVLVVVGLVAYARGPAHHRGDEVGALRVLTSHAATG